MITLALVALAFFALGAVACAALIMIGANYGANKGEFTAAYFDNKSKRWKVMGSIFPISNKILYQTIRHGPGSIK